MPIDPTAVLTFLGGGAVTEGIRYFRQRGQNTHDLLERLMERVQALEAKVEKLESYNALLKNSLVRAGLPIPPLFDETVATGATGD